MTHRYRAGLRLLATFAVGGDHRSGRRRRAGLPNKPIRWLVPFAPVGVGDQTARIVAQKVTENLHQQVVIDNRPGAGMIMSATAALQAAPDGYTIKATPAVITAIRSKDVPIAFEILPGVIGQIKAGVLRAVAVAPARRSPFSQTRRRLPKAECRAIRRRPGPVCRFTRRRRAQS